MGNEKLMDLLVFAGCLALGLVFVRLLVRAVLVLALTLAIYAVAVQALGGSGDMVGVVVDKGFQLLSVLFGALEAVVGMPGVVGLTIGAMFGLFKWKMRRDQDRGVVRFPTYPTPE